MSSHPEGLQPEEQKEGPHLDLPSRPKQPEAQNEDSQHTPGSEADADTDRAEEKSVKAVDNRGPHGKGIKSLSETISKIVSNGTRDPSTQAPGIVVQVIEANGNIINESFGGVRNLDTKEPMTADTAFWIASCTKMVTGIALLQLWEAGKADLDSADQMEEICPELKDVKIIQKGGALTKKKERITLRQCMTHTAGFSYSFFNEDIWKSHFKEDGTKDELEGLLSSMIQPLVCEPGSYRNYGCGIDWVGIFVERVSGLSLGDYFKENIFKPLKMDSTAFTLDESMAKRIVTMHSRSKDFKSLSVTKEHAYFGARGVLPADQKVFHSGGGGLISTAGDYCKLLATLLNNGTSPLTGGQILEHGTVDMMFENQLEKWDSTYKHDGFAVCREDLAQSFLRDGIPSAGPEGWGLNFQLYGDASFADKVDKKGVQFPRGGAPGLCNVFWACDRDLGIGAIIMSQIIPFGDPHVIGMWTEIQKVMFSGAHKIGAMGVQEGDE